MDVEHSLGETSGKTQDGSSALRRYRVTLENRKNRDEVKTFVITGTGYRPAWVAARELARLGEIEVDGVKLEPGGWTARELEALDKPTKKATSVTAVALIQAAVSRGVTVSPALYELLGELSPAALEEVTAAAKDEESIAEAA